ncbi:MAG: hypothetical protein J0L53_07695 [Spirochaetes bacterium]|nr:hypothetical protein [Spirochaetota bacterium]MBX3723600.1 hypothetical protein [Turneriella sp.]
MSRFKSKFLSVLMAGIIVVGCQNKPGFELDFSGSRLEVIIAGQAYATDSTYNWGNVSSGAPIVINGTLRNKSAFGITMAGDQALTVAGTHATDISLAQPANAVIAPGATENFTITVTPQAAFTRNASISITTTPGNDKFTLNLKGYRYGLVLVKDINPGAGNSSPAKLALINSTLYFAANNGTNGIELWKSDGTPEGTVMVRDINSGAGNSSPYNMTQLGSTILFAADDGSLGSELWKTDGTAGGTSLVRDIYSLATGSNIGGSIGNSFAVFNGNIYFCAETAAENEELWKSDGTFAGTQMISDLNTTAGISGCYGDIFIHSNARVLFHGRDAGSGREVFKTTGVVGNMSLVAEINPTTGWSNPGDFFNVNGVTVFTADDGSTGRELWKITGGTATGATLVKDIRVGGGNSSPQYFAVLGSNLLFAATNGSAANGTELWLSDSTLTGAGTNMLKDINAGTVDSFPKYLTTMGSRVYFQACETATDCELWMTDATVPGTVRLKDINPGAGNSSNPANLVAIGSTLYFTATDGVNGTELWRSDGTDAGTYMVSDINAGAANSSPANLTPFGNSLYFSATTATNGTELYIYVPPP